MVFKYYMVLIRENSCNPWTRAVNPWTQPALEYDTYTLYHDDILDTEALHHIFEAHEAVGSKQ